MVQPRERGVEVRFAGLTVDGAGRRLSPAADTPPHRLWAAMGNVLLAGDHGEVEAWRQDEARRLTRERRPDLWAAYLAERDSHKKWPSEG
jgi:hypothetical protein